GPLERLQIMNLVFGIVRLSRERHGEVLRSHVPLLLLLVLDALLEILLPVVFAIGQRHARQKQAERQEDGKKSAARGSNGCNCVHGDDLLYFQITQSLQRMSRD